MTLLKYGNAKLNNTLVFNLPASNEVCGRICKNCYAIKAQRIYPNVLPYRTRMLEYSQQPNFVSTIINDINSCTKPFKYIRIHESGDFYSQDYINSWIDIASSFPQYTFYAYTKRLNEFDFSSFKSLPNVVLINSLHFGKLNYGKPGSEPVVAFVCPATKLTRCGIECVYCMTKQAQHNGVYFHIH